MRVLDLGCGIGKTLETFGVADERVFGIDLNLSAVRQAIFRFPHRSYLRGAGEAIPFADRSMQLAVSNLALPYMNIPKVLREVNRVLVPGGTFTASLHPPSFTVSELKKARRPIAFLYRILVLLNGLLFHLVAWAPGESFQTQRGITHALDRAGFQKIRFFHVEDGRWMVEAEAVGIDVDWANECKPRRKCKMKTRKR